jgi:hypothetical protein
MKSLHATLAVSAVLSALALAVAVRAQTVPPVFLNHFFVVVDSASYRALQESPTMTGAFAPFEKRTTARNDQTYTGIYWYGRHTYFEAFEPDAQGPPGSSGLALGVDGAGESAAVKAAWAKAFGGADSGMVTRKTESADPAWFEMTYAKAASGLRVWLMEYDRDFLSRWYPELTPARGITRSEVLDRYVAKLGRPTDRERALFKDVTRLRLALEAADRDVLAKHLLAVGWTSRDENGALVLTGPEGVELRVVPPHAGKKGIVEATFSVQGVPAPRTEALGSATLTVEKDRATLRF